MQKKNILVFFTLLAVTSWISAQITVTNATFPVAGDSLKTATDFTPDGVTITPAGGPYSWDFTSLSPSSHQVLVLQPAVNGAAYSSFPNAELVDISEFGVETYYDVSTTVFAVLGISGSELAAGLPIQTNLIFSPPLPELHAPLTFLSLFNSNSSATIAIATADIPGGILDSLGIPTSLLDSIRIRINTQRLELVDAYGTLAIPGGTYEVLREKRTDYTTTGIDVHTFLGWVDISTFIGEVDLGIGTDTTITYNFISNTAKEPIALITADSTGLIAVEVDYKDNGVSSAVSPVIGDKPQVAVSPNPVSNIATIELKNIVPGVYALRLFDVNGKVVLMKELLSDRELVSLASLSEGLYLYHLSDVKNQIVASGKLMKLNP